MWDEREEGKLHGEDEHSDAAMKREIRILPPRAHMPLPIFLVIFAILMLRDDCREVTRENRRISEMEKSLENCSTCSHSLIGHRNDFYCY